MLDIILLIIICSNGGGANNMRLLDVPDDISSNLSGLFNAASRSTGVADEYADADMDDTTGVSSALLKTLEASIGASVGINGNSSSNTDPNLAVDDPEALLAVSSLFSAIRDGVQPTAANLGNAAAKLNGSGLVNLPLSGASTGPAPYQRKRNVDANGSK